MQIENEENEVQTQESRGETEKEDTLQVFTGLIIITLKLKFYYFPLKQFFRNFIDCLVSLHTHCLIDIFAFHVIA